MCLTVRIIHQVLYGKTKLAFHPAKWVFHFIITESQTWYCFSYQLICQQRSQLKVFYIMSRSPVTLMQCKGSLAVKQLIIKLILGILIMPVRLKWIWILFRIIVMKLMLTVVFYSTAVRSKWTKFFLLFPFFFFPLFPFLKFCIR